jgi:hypothetical protein
MALICLLLLIAAFVLALLAAFNKPSRFNMIGSALACYFLNIILPLLRTLFLITALLLCTSCTSPKFVKSYDRTKISKGFTQTEDSLADAKRFTQDAKDEIREINSNSKRIDNKASVILKNWDKAK